MNIETWKVLLCISVDKFAFLFIVLLLKLKEFINFKNFLELLRDYLSKQPENWYTLGSIHKWRHAKNEIFRPSSPFVLDPPQNFHIFVWKCHTASVPLPKKLDVIYERPYLKLLFEK